VFVLKKRKKTEIGGSCFEVLQHFCKAGSHDATFAQKAWAADSKSRVPNEKSLYHSPRLFHHARNISAARNVGATYTLPQQDTFSSVFYIGMDWVTLLAYVGFGRFYWVRYLSLGTGLAKC